MKLTLWFDGGCGPNNPGGIATYGWLVKDEAGRLVGSGKGVAHNGGPLATNNVAEWSGLIKGLRFIAGLAQLPTTLLIYGDSQLVINQFNRRWKCNKPHLQNLCNRAHKLIAELGIKPTACWIPREQNTEADTLSETACYEAGGTPFRRPLRQHATMDFRTTDDDNRRAALIWHGLLPF
jgi:ribonuclease HI